MWGRSGKGTASEKGVSKAEAIAKLIPNQAASAQWGGITVMIIVNITQLAAAARTYTRVVGSSGRLPR
jgi:hypothetical protein